MGVYVQWAKQPHARPNLCLCYMNTVDDSAARYAECRTRHPDWPEQMPVLSPCPVDVKKLATDGACAKCRKCVTGVPVWFKTK